MKTTSIGAADLVLQMREDTENPDVIATGYGRAVPYGVEIEIGGIRESFAQGSIDPATVVGRPLAYRHNEPIGVITGATSEADGLYIDFSIANTALGRDGATLIRTGSSTGLSVGFNPVKMAWNRAKTSVQYVAAQIAEVSLTHQPAYPTAGISQIREEEQMSETTIEETAAPVALVDTEAREAIADVRREIATYVQSKPEVHPLARFRSLGEYRTAVMAGEIEARALFDQVTGDNPGVMPPVWSQVVRGLIDHGRPMINAFGTVSAGDSGTTFNWPYWDGNLLDIVEEQMNEKDEVNSVQISILKGDATLRTFAAGSDISYQLLQRSSPSYVDAHTRIMLNSYVQVTDLAFVADVYAARTPLNYDFASDTDGSAFREAVFEASVDVQTATGMPAEFVIVSPTVFKKIGGWTTFFPAAYPVSNVSGTATASSLGVNVSGLPVILDRNVGGSAIIVSNREAAKWIEDGPRLAAAENVAQLGRDVAVYGYGASQIISSAGIIGLQVVAP